MCETCLPVRTRVPSSSWPTASRFPTAFHSFGALLTIFKWQPLSRTLARKSFLSTLMDRTAVPLDVIRSIKRGHDDCLATRAPPPYTSFLPFLVAVQQIVASFIGVFLPIGWYFPSAAADVASSHFDSLYFLFFSFYWLLKETGRVAPLNRRCYTAR